MKGYDAIVPLRVVLMQVLFETLEYMVSLFLLLCIEGYGELERQVALLDGSFGNHLGVLGEDWFGDHGVLGLHEGEGCVFAISVEVSIEVIVILEEIGEEQLSVVIGEFVLDLDEAFLRVKDESLEPAL